MVRLLPYKQRRSPPVEGVVTYVSADRLVDKQSGQPYYEAKIRLDITERSRNRFAIEINKKFSLAAACLIRPNKKGRPMPSDRFKGSVNLTA